MNAAQTFGITILLVLLMLLFGSLYTVTEGQRALLLRWGQIVLDKQQQPQIFKPGLHVKWPIVNQVRKFDLRLQTLAVQSSRILTQEQKYLLVDYFIKWRISDLAMYYQRTGGDALRAQTLLQQQVNDSLRAAFGKLTIVNMLSNKRDELMNTLRASANETAKNLGIKVVDVRIKSIDLPKEVSDSVFARMRAQREQVATQHRANGKAEAEKIKATADAQATVLIAQTKTQAANIRAQGIAQAANVYATAYTKDPDFFGFYSSLEAYKHIFNNKNDILILRPDAQFFNYFNNARGASK